ncbi:2774_t:CDS:2 [Funneliformis mosseae]|uniref:2774_t:CDS:1 n=1 Tax=Funneliformis mosseae TaxID=27381 RepID=A0A9N9BMY7_FUNMO|nr:2774_t:CDS:2 [Funneliformis mosseae]
MDHFTKNPNIEFTDDSENVLEGSDQINILEVSTPKESTTPIPLVNISNSSDNFKEEVWFDENMFFNETNFTKVNTTTSDNDDVYFDEANEEVKIDIDNNSNEEFSNLVLNNDKTKNATVIQLQEKVEDFWDKKLPKRGCTHVIINLPLLVKR